MTDKKDKIWKLTLYMTDKQWEALSLWSAPFAGKENAAWLFLEHELSPEGEYEAKKYIEDHSIPEQMIYTTSPSLSSS